MLVVPANQHLIAFDACLKKSASGIGAGTPDEARGSWLKEALDLGQDLIIYLDKHISPGSRTLRHPRFTKM